MRLPPEAVDANRVFLTRAEQERKQRRKLFLRLEKMPAPKRRALVSRARILIEVAGRIDE